MIITNDKLIELAKQEAEQRGANDDVISAYIVGSVASGDPLVGGNADIDLVLIHSSHPTSRREVVAISPQVHIDIAHHSQGLYSRPRKLRTHPWLGPSMCEPIFLFDPQHFFEWAQASVRGQFHREDHVLARSRSFLRRARSMGAALAKNGNWVSDYLHAILEAANSAACLAGFPAAGRRMGLVLEQRAAILDKPEVWERMCQLVGADRFNSWDMPEQLSAWARAFDAAAEISQAPELHPSRRDYYLHAFQELADMGRPDWIAWPLLATWSRSIQSLENEDSRGPHMEAWEHTLASLNIGEGQISNHLERLEEYLDSIEEIIEAWGDRHGV